MACWGSQRILNTEAWAWTGAMLQQWQRNWAPFAVLVFPWQLVFTQVCRCGSKTYLHNFAVSFDIDCQTKVYPKIGTLYVWNGRLGVLASYNVTVYRIKLAADMATPALNRFGSNRLKSEFLSPSIAGDVVACLGVSEVGSGSDVASIKTTALPKRGVYASLDHPSSVR